ncbi:MAG TPA: CopD family protein [Gaiellaceae bacterium]|nr:CopD family protein [Gaiellaceae bacterium]
MKRLLLACVALALALPSSAWAHATLRATTPAFGHEVRTSPPLIRLHFDQHVKILPGAIEVLNDSGRNFAGPARTSGTDVIASVRKLPAGPYTVRWRAISADSHVVSGVWTFGLRVPAPSVQDAYGAGGPTVAEHLVRWVWFLSLALAIGALGFRLICLRGLALPLALERRLAVAAGLGVTVALQAGIAAFSLRSEDALQLPFSRFLYGDLSPMAVTRFGRAFIVMTLGFALVLALIYLAWLLDRTVFLVPAFALSLLFVSGLSLSGHDAVDPGSSWKSELADWVHISAASLWVGGLATLVGVVWYGAPDLRRVAFRRFSELATVAIALVLAAGVYLSIVRLPHLHDLWTVGYGRVLLVKIGLVSCVLAWGGFHKFVIAPALERADGAGFLTRIGRSLAGESLLGAAVLLVAAILVDSRPPAPAVKTAPVAAARR